MTSDNGGTDTASDLNIKHKQKLKEVDEDGEGEDQSRNSGD